MRLKNKLKSLNLKIICLMMIIITLSNLVVQAATGNLGSINKMGTNEALGSPLLNEDYNMDTWDSDELVIFGIFLSNFVTPMIDDYESAFMSGSGKGSNGYGYHALQFGSGVTEEVLKSMLSFAIKAEQEPSAMKMIYMDYPHTDVGDASTTQPEGGTNNDRSIATDNKPKQATLKDFLEFYDDEKSSNTVSTVTLGGNNVNINTSSLKEQNFRRFYLDIKDANLRKKTIFDFNESYDKQMMLLFWNSMIYKKDVSSDYKNIYKKDTIEKNEEFYSSPLYMDAFGNIVFFDKSSGRYLMLFPACANQHITQGKQYNLLTSVFLGGNYTDINTQQFWTRIEAQKFGLDDYNYSNPALGNKSTVDKKGVMQEGDFVLSYDFASMLRNIKEVKESAGNKSTFFSSSINKNATLNLGEAVLEFMRSDINKGSRNYIGLKVQVTDPESWMDNLSNSWNDMFKNSDSTKKFMSAVYTDLDGMDPSVPTLWKIQVKGGSTVLSLFDKGVVTSTHMGVSNINDTYSDANVKRRLAGYLGFWIMDRPSELTYTSVDTIESNLRESTTFKELNDLVFGAKSESKGGMSTIFAEFVSKSGWARVKEGSKTLSEVGYNDLSSAGYKKLTDWFSNINDSKLFERLVKVYPKNSVMREVNKVMRTDSDADFSKWSPWIYLTYLEWYGLTDKFGANKLDTTLFAKNSFSIDLKEFTSSYMTKEEKLDAIRDKTYLMLDPEKGKKLRNQISTNDFTETIHGWYQKIVYGGAVESSFQSGARTTATRNSSGFLSVSNYHDNPFTSWFVDGYGSYALVLLGIGILMTFVLGIIGRRKLRWFVVSLMLIVNVIIITPSIGDVVPFISNNMLQNTFKDKLKFWAISESVENAKMEKLSNIKDDYGNNVTNDVLNLVKMFNVTYLDRSLMLKLDISRKVNESELGNLAELQKFKSTKWLLPSILRQYSEVDNSKNYIYVPLGDALENARNMYWYYNPSESIVSAEEGTNGAATGSESGLEVDQYSASDWYEGYVNTKMSYNDEESIIASEKIDNPYHTFFYINPYITNLPQLDFSNISNTEGKEKLNQEIIEKSQELSNYTEKGSFRDACSVMETNGGRYDSWQPNSVIDIYGYMWMTESPLTYFYFNVKDTFSDTSSTGLPFNTPDLPNEKDGKVSISNIAYILQGAYRVDDEGNEYRQTFMHKGNTGKLKDFLDMRDVFTNVIPYMYTNQIIAGGLDGDSGIFGEELIEDYTIYQKNKKSWLFRSNWVTKIMESKQLTKSEKVKDKEGNEYLVENPLLPSCYPENRPMVFSESEMIDQGLNEMDLSIIELKILNMNKETFKDWTLMLNYVNMDGVTPEVIYQHLSLQALFNFNKEFTTEQFMTDALALYPNNVDLRNISFDSVMRVLMLNATRDTNYVYGDTMYSVISNADIISATLLLICSAVCVWFIPLSRNILMFLLLFLGIWSTLTNLIIGEGVRWKVTVSYIVNLLVFLVLNLSYYLIIAVMLNVNSPNDVLTVNTIKADIQSPVWIILILMFLSSLYLIAEIKLIKFTLDNYKDMGAEIYEGLVINAVNTLQKGMSNLGGNISKVMSRGESDEVNINNSSNINVSVTSESSSSKEVEYENDIKISDKPSRLAGAEKRNVDDTEFILRQIGEANKDK